MQKLTGLKPLGKEQEDKVMEAPEKIYIDDPTGEFNDNWSIYQNNISTEYIRTDVFMEKAYEWIKKGWSETNDRFKEDYTGMLFEDFKKYMEGE